MTENAPSPLLPAAAIDGLPESRVRHPLNPRSDVYIKPLSRAVGLRRAHLSIARIPPGRDSFAFHRHASEEEFVYILAGRGRAEIGDDRHEIGPGDYLGFPPNGPAHLIVNSYDEDLVCLMGGENREVEIGEFPRDGKLILRRHGEILMVDTQAATPMTLADFLVPSEKR